MGTQPVLHSFTYCIQFLQEQTDGLTAAELVQMPGGVTNHPLWAMGHLTHVCQDIGGVFGVSPWLSEDWAKLYGSGSAPVADASRYPTREQALTMLEDAAARIRPAIERLDDSALNQPFPDPLYHEVFPTIRHFLVQVMVGHTSYHVGQVGVWRRAMGLAPMRRSFE